MGQQLHDGGTPSWIGARRHISSRFIQNDVAATTLETYPRSIDSDFTLVRIGLGAELFDHPTVYLDTPFDNHLLSSSARCQPGAGYDLLEPFFLARFCRHSTYGIFLVVWLFGFRRFMGRRR